MTSFSGYWAGFCRFLAIAAASQSGAQPLAKGHWHEPVRNLVLVGYNLWAGIGLAASREMSMRVRTWLGLSITLIFSGPVIAEPVVSVKFNERCGFASAGQMAHLINSDAKRVYKVVVKEIFNPWGGGKPTETLKSFTLKPTEDRSLQCSYGDDHYPYKMRWVVVSETPS
jgi:hypothetical protein